MRLAEVGVALVIPDLAPDFTHLTVTSMLGIVEALLVEEDAVLLGSSLGGYLATLVAARKPERVRGLVLFAPAFGFARRWEERIGPAAVARWRAARTAPCFHYGLGREVPLDITLLDDARTYPEEPDPPAPTLIFAGRHDDAVPLAAIEPFASNRPTRTLIIHDAGHELTEVLDPMWHRTHTFLKDLHAL